MLAIVIIAIVIIPFMNYQENRMYTDYTHHIGDLLEGWAILRNLISNLL